MAGASASTSSRRSDGWSAPWQTQALRLGNGGSPDMGGEDRIGRRLHELTGQAVAEGLLDAASRAYDITQQVIHQGFDSLTPPQRQAYITEAVPVMRRRFLRECSDNDNDAD
jgi:hypothetical protein